MCLKNANDDPISGVIILDWNYDGEWKGDQLMNGLGCLADGNMGPEDYKLSYYAKSKLLPKLERLYRALSRRRRTINIESLFVTDRGWVGWKNDRRDSVEILFEFDQVREFDAIHVFTNNQFTRDVAVFKEMHIHFSIGGEVFNSEPVSYVPMEDQIIEVPRNVSAKLHRRIGRYLKVRLFFASKWILISEVSFESSVARGNYTVEAKPPGPPSGGEGGAAKTELSHASVKEVDAEPGDGDASPDQGESAYMPVIVGVLTTVIVLLAAVIFFIVSRSRQKKWFGVHAKSDCAVPAEKIALNPNDGMQFSYDPFMSGPGSDSGSNSNGSRNGAAAAVGVVGTAAAGGGRKMPLLDDNYNTPHGGFGSPRSPRYTRSREGSMSSSRRASPAVRRATPSMTPRHVATQRRVIANPFHEPPMYMEPYHVMRYSPYLRCGNLPSEPQTESDCLIKESALHSGEDL